MDEFIRSLAAPIIGLLLEVLIMIGLAFSAVKARKRIEREIHSYVGYIRFTYSGVLRSIMVIGAIGFGASAIMSATLPDWIDWWIPAMFLAFSITAAVIWYYLTGEIIIDTNGVTMVRLWTRKRIEYGDLEYIRDHKTGNYVVLHASNKRIRIEYQLQEFQTFLATLYMYFEQATGKKLPSR